MNCNELNNAWDEYRDGTLPEDRRAAVAAHLLACGRCAERYKRESAWLAMLADEPAVHGGDAFAAAVIDRLDRRDDQPVAKIGWRRWAVAAAVLIAGLLTTVVMMNGPQGRPVAMHGGEDPVSVLVLDVTGQLDRPLVWRGSFNQDAALSTLKTLAELFDEQGDPAIRG